IISNFHNSESRMLIFDFDGTMVPFQSKAEHAIPSEALTEVIDKLKNDPKTHVAIISGRDKNFLEEYFGNTNFHLAAEYGAKIRAPGKEWVQPQKFDVEWMENVKQKMDDFIRSHELENKVRIETKETSLVLHYRELYESKSLDKDREEVKATMGGFFDELTILNKRNQIPGPKLTIHNDNLAVEVRISFSKGDVVRELLTSSPETNDVFCFGDSKADEDMFEALLDMQKTKKTSLSSLNLMHVDNAKGSPTRAQYRSKDAQEITNLLRDFVQLEYKSVELNYAATLKAAEAKRLAKLKAAEAKRLANLEEEKPQDLSA
ncbi:hypothetical protein KEM48_004386, partial [Puccinia striiformis f. sp. tritici PST-130]